MAATAMWAVSCGGGPSGPVASAVVVAHVDGDTIDVEVAGRRERVRLVGIDTPELARDGRPAECYAERAAARLAELLPVDQPVVITRDIVPRDDYGRLLGYLYLPPGPRPTAGSRRETDLAHQVNLRLVREGAARPLNIAPNDTFAVAFVEAARAAERDDLGLWHRCRG